MLSPLLGKVLFEGKEQPGVVYIPYGMFANIEEEIPSGILLDQGNEESLIYLPFDIKNREELEEGEVGFGIPKLNSRIIFKKNGDIEILNNNGKMTFKENGQLDVNGNFTVDP